MVCGPSLALISGLMVLLSKTYFGGYLPMAFLQIDGFAAFWGADTAFSGGGFKREVLKNREEVFEIYFWKATKLHNSKSLKAV